MKEVKSKIGEWKNILFNSIFAIFTLLIVVLFNQEIIYATIILLIISIIGLIKWKSKITFTIFIITAISGPIAEMIAIYFGAWNYTSNNILSIPSYLPLVWGNAGAFIYQTARELNILGIKK